MADKSECSAVRRENLMVCARCGYEWNVGAKAPACKPITFQVLFLRMMNEVSAAETSLRIVSDLRVDGMPADPAPARRRLAELNAVLRLADQCSLDSTIRDRLNGKS